MTTQKTTAKKKQKRKKRQRSYSLVTRIKELITFNIGTVIFGAIFLYMAIALFMYLTTNKITSYQVISGPLAQNQTYTGLIVREEQVVTANSSGYITYYAKDNAKVKKSGIVYSIGESRTNPVSIEMTDSALNTLQTNISSFSVNFGLTDYNDLYNFKYELESSLLQNTGISDSTITQNGGNATLGNQTLCSSPSDGIVLYSIDGYEDFTDTTITSDDINKKAYSLTDLKTDQKISAGDPVYKIISDDAWSIYIPLTTKQIIQLGDRTSVHVKFLKDGATQVAGFTIHTNEDGSYWGELTFTSGMIRYSTDRFIDIELVTNASTGLKIPISSIVTKEFYIIPESYATQGGDSDDTAFNIERKDSKDGPTIEHLTIYANMNGYYYINMDDLDEGDVVIQDSSSNRKTIGETDTLEGVYCINKGYAVFRKVIIIDKNDEYCIVEKGTKYGISQFDHIVRNGSAVNEDQILY